MEFKEDFFPLSVGNTRACRRGCPMCERNESAEGCNGCTSGKDPLHGYSLAMVYSPEQAFDGLYEPEEGLTRGTVFIALEKPFFGDGRKC